MIEKSKVLECGVRRAFDLFTTQAGVWWPPTLRHTGDAASTIVMLESGRFFERGRDGHEVELGVVRAWEAPSRLVLDWYPGTGPEHPTCVEVRFTAEGTSATRVDIRHTPLPVSETLYPTRAHRYDAAWTLVLDALWSAAGA